jgi:hypothetical protein
MPDIEYIRAEIERMRLQVLRQRGEIRQLQRAGIVVLPLVDSRRITSPLESKTYFFLASMARTPLQTVLTAAGSLLVAFS